VCGHTIVAAGSLADDQFDDFDIHSAQAAFFERGFQVQYGFQRNRTIAANSNI
jgi:hypothetical protein